MNCILCILRHIFESFRPPAWSICQKNEDEDVEYKTSEICWRHRGHPHGHLVCAQHINMQVDQILSLSRPQKKSNITPSTWNITSLPPPTCLDTQVLCGLVCASNNQQLSSTLRGQQSWFKYFCVAEDDDLFPNTYFLISATILCSVLFFCEVR